MTDRMNIMLAQLNPTVGDVAGNAALADTNVRLQAGFCDEQECRTDVAGRFSFEVAVPDHEHVILTLPGGPRVVDDSTSDVYQFPKCRHWYRCEIPVEKDLLVRTVPSTSTAMVSSSAGLDSTKVPWLTLAWASSSKLVVLAQS